MRVQLPKWAESMLMHLSVEETYALGGILSLGLLFAFVVIVTGHIPKLF